MWNCVLKKKLLYFGTVFFFFFYQINTHYSIIFLHSFITVMCAVPVICQTVVSVLCANSTLIFMLFINQASMFCVIILVKHWQVFLSLNSDQCWLYTLLYCLQSLKCRQLSCLCTVHRKLHTTFLTLQLDSLYLQHNHALHMGTYQRDRFKGINQRDKYCSLKYYQHIELTQQIAWSQRLHT